jgi:hypothetical protein
MDLSSAIKAFNLVSQPQIQLTSTRIGSVLAKLPRVQREVTVADSEVDPRFKVGPDDVVWLIEEARRSAAPAEALLAAALGALVEVTVPRHQGEPGAGKDG